MSPRAAGTRTPPEQKGMTFESVEKRAVPAIFVDLADGSEKKVVRLFDNKTQDGDSAMRVTKAPTEGSANWIKSVSGVSGSKAERDLDLTPQNPQANIINLNRLQNLGLGRLAVKIGQNIQVKVAEEVSKYDKPIKLKVMTGRDIKKMKNQFSIFFEEPKTKAAAMASHYR